MDKYYTPELEEFYLGFECELYVPDSEQWVLCGYMLGHTFEKLQQLLDKNLIRVKYLDKGNIENLGFKINSEKTNEKLWVFEKDNLILGYRPSLKTLTIFTKDPSKDDYFSKFSVDRFAVNNIIIKNKSEFKKLLKQININE